MSRGKLPPITFTDVILFAMVLTFEVIGIGVFYESIKEGFFSPYILVWCALFIAIPAYIGWGSFRRYVKLFQSHKNGTKIQAKVVGARNDPSLRVNGAPVKDIQVRFFDRMGDVAEKTIDLNALSLLGYPVGSTVDIIEYQGEYTLASRGYGERISGEDALMAYQAPLPMQSQKTMHVITCPCCGGQVAIDEFWRPSRVSNGG